MDRDAALEKIRKCLALSKSPNENEARTALVMARRLMAEYKICSLDEIDPKHVPEERETPITFSAGRDIWILDLSWTIAGRYCCHPFNNREYRKKTRTACFLGFPEDLDVCIPAFELAVTAIRYGIKRLCLDKAGANSYADGFIKGLKKEFARQDAEMMAASCTERSLSTVLKVPIEVKNYADEHFETSTISCSSYTVNKTAYNYGYADGCSHVGRKVRGAPVKELKE